MILWHATDYQNIPNIMAKGIIPNRYNEVFFADNCASAMMFVAMRGHTHIVALPVEFKPAEVKESFDHSQEFYRCRACFVGVMGHYNCALYGCEILSWRASMITGTLEILKCEKCKERNAGKS